MEAGVCQIHTFNSDSNDIYIYIYIYIYKRSHDHKMAGLYSSNDDYSSNDAVMIIVTKTQCLFHHLILCKLFNIE